jgi:hypothetical protein
MPIFACGGCVTDLFVTEEELVDRFTGTELWLWGRGNYGQIGNNTLINRSSPTQTISGGTNWKSASVGKFHAGAIKTKTKSKQKDAKASFCYVIISNLIEYVYKYV